jgi:hypothetical protein
MQSSLHMHGGISSQCSATVNGLLHRKHNS